MFPRDFRGAKITLIAVALLGLVQSLAFAQTGTIKGTITKADGSGIMPPWSLPGAVDVHNAWADTMRAWVSSN